MAHSHKTFDLIDTKTFAERLGVKPGTIHSALSREGHYLGIKPVRLPNRFLRWHEGDLIALIEGGATPRRREG